MAYDIFRKTQTSKSWAMGSDVGAPWVVYDAEVMKELDDLQRDVDGINDDFTGWIKKNQKKPGAAQIWARWAAFRDGVYGTYKSWTDTVILTPSGSAHSLVGRRKFYDIVKNLQEQALAWRKRYEEVSGERSSTPFASKPPSQDQAGGNFWKWVAAIALGAAGATIVAKKIGA